MEASGERAVKVERATETGDYISLEHKRQVWLLSEREADDLCNALCREIREMVDERRALERQRARRLEERQG